MKFSQFALLLVLLSFAALLAQEAAPPPVQTLPPHVDKQPAKVYYGGQVGFNFGDYFRISLVPLVGYKLSPKFSIGGKLRYEYVNDKRYDQAITAHNYGGSIFGRYYISRNLYAHAEFSYMSYQYQTKILDRDFKTERDWVPFGFIGAGYAYPVSRSTYAFVEVLWDVIQHENSPYKAGEPFISVGVSAGF